MNAPIAIGQDIIGIFLMISILMQARGSGLSATFGGDSSVYRSRRGIERRLWQFTILLGDPVLLLLRGELPQFIEAAQPGAGRHPSLDPSRGSRNPCRRCPAAEIASMKTRDRIAIGGMLLILAAIGAALLMPAPGQTRCVAHAGPFRGSVSGGRARPSELDQPAHGPHAGRPGSGRPALPRPGSRRTQRLAPAGPGQELDGRGRRPHLRRSRCATTPSGRMAST